MVSVYTIHRMATQIVRFQDNNSRVLTLVKIENAKYYVSLLHSIQNTTQHDGFDTHTPLNIVQMDGITRTKVRNAEKVIHLDIY